jgi:hypothetical protein
LALSWVNTAWVGSDEALAIREVFCAARSNRSSLAMARALSASFARAVAEGRLGHRVVGRVEDVGAAGQLDVHVGGHVPHVGDGLHVNGSCSSGCLPRPWGFSALTATVAA